MLLLQRIGEIFDTSLSDGLARYRVPDGGTDRGGLEVVLLVESPDTHEVCYSYPLAGVSGIHVRDVLGKKAERLFPNEPIGRSVYDNHPCFLRLGVMNVSQLPFRSDAYDCLPVRVANDCRDSEHWNDYKGHMATIKAGPRAGSRDCRNCRRLDEAIAEDLRGRLECLLENNPDVLLARCGKVAQAFYDKTGVDMPHCDLPHPTRRARDRIGRKKGWLTLNHDESQCLQNIVAHLWPPQPGT